MSVSLSRVTYLRCEGPVIIIKAVYSMVGRTDVLLALILVGFLVWSTSTSRTIRGLVEPYSISDSISVDRLWHIPNSIDCILVSGDARYLLFNLVLARSCARTCAS